MELLLTLEFVVDNLAECLKNSDLMAALTRFVSPLHTLVLTFLFATVNSYFFFFFAEQLLQIFLPALRSCPTGRALDSSVWEERTGADIREAPLSQRSLDRQTEGLILLAVRRWTGSKSASSRFCWPSHAALPLPKTTSATLPVSTTPATCWQPSSGWPCRWWSPTLSLSIRCPWDS